MEDDDDMYLLGGINNGNCNGNGGGGTFTTTTQQLLDIRVVQTFLKKFVQVQTILDQNRLLINEINQNHHSKIIPYNLTRNVPLIRELNNNIRRVVTLYSDLSTSFFRSMLHAASSSSEAQSAGTTSKSDGKIKSSMKQALVPGQQHEFYFVQGG